MFVERYYYAQLYAEVCPLVIRSCGRLRFFPTESDLPTMWGDMLGQPLDELGNRMENIQAHSSRDTELAD